MLTIFILQWKRLLKQPALILTFFGLTLLFVYFLAGGQGNQTITVPTYSNELTSVELNDWLDRLNEEEIYAFEETEEETVREAIRMNERSFALELSDQSYRFLIGREDMEISPVIRFVEQQYRTVHRLEEAASLGGVGEIELREFITVETVARSEVGSSNEQYRLGVVFGMTLYFSIFSILFLMVNLIEEKVTGTWQRLIFSPLTKARIYLGQLFHYGMAGVIQIVLALIILRALIGFDVGDNYAAIALVILSFVFAIVSLGLVLMGLVQTPQQLQIVIPIVGTSMAMLGGAFWPLEVVNNRFLLFIADLMPIRYGMEGLTGAILRNESIPQLAGPVLVLLAMGIIFMAIGLNLMEKISEN
ncbi:MAG: ABC transporter permease [Alkalibacterium sp.]|nr:ABC transporter permease [Alkalibacterium sp.]